jgi:hypothetical protein
MTQIATPNGLAIAGALFMLSGLAVLGAALIARTNIASFAPSKEDLNSKLAIAAGFGLPMVELGLFLQAAGNMVTTSIGPGITMLLLGLALVLLLFVMLDETIAEMMGQQASQPKADQVQLALPAPAVAHKVAAEVIEAAPDKGLALAS